ncbi:MAG: hypothetical protein HYV09_34445 [Deltaproteobacteria bacterium]|nr:hypothetical protein [Deltaproteobacteria bacterium]
MKNMIATRSKPLALITALLITSAPASALAQGKDLAPKVPGVQSKVTAPPSPEKVAKAKECGHPEASELSRVAAGHLPAD